MKSSLMSYARWLIVKSLVDYGLNDTWRVRIGNKEFCRTFSLKQCGEIQGNAEALFELTHGDGSSRLRMEVSPHYRHRSALMGVLVLALGFIAIALAVWIFHANPMTMPQRLIWCICTALVVTVLLFSELWFASGSCIWVGYLLTCYPNEFTRGLLRGGTGGAILGLIMWNNAGPWSRGIWLITTIAVAGALVGGFCAAHAFHEKTIRLSEGAFNTP